MHFQGHSLRMEGHFFLSQRLCMLTNIALAKDPSWSFTSRTKVPLSLPVMGGLCIPAFPNISRGIPSEVPRRFWPERVLGTRSLWDRRRGAWSSKMKDSATYVCLMLPSTVLNKLTNVRMCYINSPESREGQRDTLGPSGAQPASWGSGCGNHVPSTQAWASKSLSWWTGNSSVCAG